MTPEAPEAAELVLASPDGSSWGAVDFSPDSSKLLIIQYVSVTDSRIHLLDLGPSHSVCSVTPVTPSVNCPLDFPLTVRALFTIKTLTFRRLAYYSCDVTSGLRASIGMWGCRPMSKSRRSR